MQGPTLQELPLDEVAGRARAGDSEAEEYFFSNLRVRFLDIAKRRVRRDDVEDLAQEALRVIHGKYRDLETAKGILIWAMTVLRNVIGNYYQKREKLDRGEPFEEEIHRSPGRPGEDGAGPDAFCSAEEQTELILRSIRRLGESDSRCRRLFQRVLESLQEGGSPREISQRTMEQFHEDFPGQSRESLYVALHRCRGRLREILRQQEREFGEVMS